MGASTSRLRVQLLAALAVLLLLAVALYAYHGTKNAFLWVYLPILDQLVPGELRSAGGRLSLRGHLEAYGLEYRYQRGDRRVEVDLGRGTLDFAPLSWLTDPPFRARDLRIERVRVRITIDTTRDPLTQPPLLVPPGKEPPEIPELPVLRVPFAVDRLLIESFEVEIHDGDRTRAIVGPGRIELSGLEPGRTVQLDVTSGAELAPGELGHYEGKLRLSLGVSLDAEGEIIDARGDGDIVLLFADQPEQPPLDIELSLDARSPVRGILDTTITLDAAHGEKAIGRAEGAFHISRPDSEPVFQALLVLAGVDADLLNIALAYLGNERIATATLNAAAVVTRRGRKAPVTTQFEIDVAKLRGLSRDEIDELPAMDVHALSRGDWNPDQGRFDLEQLAAWVHREGRDRLRVALAQPVTLLLPGRDEEQGLRFPGRATIAVEADGIDLRELPHLLAMLGSRPLLPLERGLLSGDLVVDIEEMGRRITTSGALSCSDARLSRELTGRDIEPLELRARVEGQLDTFEKLVVRKLDLDVARQDVDLASLALRGSWDAAKETTDLDLELEARSLATLLAELELAPSPSAARLEGGALTAGLQLHFAAGQPELDITGELRVADLTLSRGDTAAVTADLELGAGAKLVRQTGDLQLRQFELSLQPRDEPGPARIRATGVIPTRNEGDHEGLALRTSIENLAARPWLVLAGVADPGLGPLPVAGTLSIGFEEEPATLKLAPNLSVRLRPASATTADEEITATIDGRADAILGGRTRFAAHVSSGGDDLDIDGVWKPGARPHLLLSTEVRSLQVQTYEALFAGRTGPASEPSQDSAPAAVADAGTERRPLPLDVVFRGEVASLHYGAIPFEDARIEVEAVAGGIDVSLPAAKLSGGAVRGRLKRRAEGTGTEHLEVELHGKRVDLRPILAELAPALAIKDGMLDVSLSGSAETPVGREHLDTFDGNLSLLLDKGHIISRDFNAALAGDLFSRSLEGLAFDGLDAQLEIADGVARIQHMRVLGTAARLQISGQVTLRGHVDARISTEIGPELQSFVEPESQSAGMIRGVGNLIMVPVQITAQGQIPAIRYAARTGLPGQPLGPAGEVVGDVTQGTVETIGEAVRMGIEILTTTQRREVPEETQPE